MLKQEIMQYKPIFLNNQEEKDPLNLLLEDFEPIGLEKMDSVKLMDRKECKYSLSYERMLTLLSRIKDQYFILDIGGTQKMPYESVYFDSPDFNLYTSHQNGKKNRYKVRSRTYGLTGASFLELKFKNNKGRTLKKRIPLRGNWDLEAYSYFLSENLPFPTANLEEKIQVKYNRLTLVDKGLKERVTIDMDLSFLSDGKESTCGGLSIIERKFQGDNRDSSMGKLLQEYRIKPLSISKYCLAISRHYSEVKHNLINVKIRQIDKSIALDDRRVI